MRRRLLGLRDSLEISWVSEMSRLVVENFWENFLANPVLRKASCIALYASVRREVETAGLFEKLRKDGKSLFYPKVSDEKNRLMDFIKVEALADLKKSQWGILEPKSGVAVEVSQMDVVVLPGLAFDKRGYRLGFGKGYYDRALSNFRGLRVGLAFELQMVEDIAPETHDVPCDWVFTEKRSLKF